MIQLRAQDPELWGLSALAEEAGHLAGLEVIECIYADPRKMIPMAESVGVHPGLFEGDLRLLYLAAEVGRHLNRRNLYRFARLALRREGRWDERAVMVDYGRCWGPPTLAKLFTIGVASPQALGVYSDRLVEIRRRQTEARRLYDRCRELLAGLVRRDFHFELPAHGDRTSYSLEILGVSSPRHRHSMREMAVSR